MSPLFIASYVVLWVLVIFEGAIVLGLVHLTGRLLAKDQQRTRAPVRSRDGQLAPGQEAPLVAATGLTGEAVNSRDFAGKPWALLFVSPTCLGCATTLADLKVLEGKVQGNLLVICRADATSCMRLAETYDDTARTVADADDRITRLYGISSTPTAVLIDSQNRIEKYGAPHRDGVAEVLANDQTISATAGGS